MTTAVLAVTAISIFELYNDALDEHAGRLEESAASIARLVEFSASLAATESADSNREILRTAVTAALDGLAIETETGEIALMEHREDRIEIVYSLRGDDSGAPGQIPFDGEWAEPMRHALAGRTGVSRATDYLGNDVLAAYRPLFAGNLGLVVKIDIEEIRRPFLRAVLLASGLAVLLVLGASRLFFRVSSLVEQEMTHLSETFQILARTAREGIILADTHGRIEYVNPAAESLFGYARGELLGESIKRLMPAEHRRVHDDYVNRYLQTGMPKIIGSGRHLTAKRKDGSRFPIYLSIGDINSSHRRVFAGVILDMSEQRQLQREILEIPVSEQRRIGQELHDGLGQQLTGLGMLATSLQNKASKPDYELAARLASGLQDAIAQVRALSRGLMPVNVDAEGFISALKELTDSVRVQTGIEISLKVKERVQISDSSSALHLYRIAQEAINNALKHARARRIEVAVGIENGRGCLSVRDNGTGFVLSREIDSGLGLRIMRHRCSLIDADLEIDSDATDGCEIKCYFALDSNTEVA